MAVQKTKTVDKWKKKNWYKVLAPSQFKSQVLQEIPVQDIKTVVGRKITMNMMNLTGDMRKKNTEVVFKITDVKEGQAHTEIESYKILPTSIKRMVRRGKDRLDESFILTTKDGKTARIKVMLLTVSNTSRSAHTAIKHILSNFLINKAKESAFLDFFSDVSMGKIQQELKRVVSKVYPVRMVDILAFKVEKLRRQAKVRQVVTKQKIVDLEKRIEESQKMRAAKVAAKKAEKAEKAEKTESAEEAEEEAA